MKFKYTHLSLSVKTALNKVKPGIVPACLILGALSGEAYGDWITVANGRVGGGNGWSDTYSKNPKTVSLNPNTDTSNSNDQANVHEGSVSIGFNSTAMGTNAVALGRESKAEAQESIAVGYNSQGNSNYAIGIGGSAVANGEGAIVLGSGSSQKDYSNGNYSETINIMGTSYSSKEIYNAKEGIVIGYKSTGQGTGTVTIGSNIKNSARSSVTIGREAESKTSRSVVIGYLAGSTSNNANFGDNVVVGVGARGLSDQSTAIGAFTVSGRQATAVGANTIANGFSSVAIGSDDLTNNQGDGATGLYGTKLSDEIAKKAYSEINSYYDYNKDPSKKVYSPTYAGGVGAIALGSRTVAAQDFSTSIGSLSFALAKNSTTLGVGAYVDPEATGATAIGDTTSAFSKQAIVMGSTSQATSEGSLVYGFSSFAVAPNSIAVGASSVAGAAFTGGFGNTLRSMYEKSATANITARNKLQELITAGGSNSKFYTDVKNKGLDSFIFYDFGAKTYKINTNELNKTGTNQTAKDKVLNDVLNPLLAARNEALKNTNEKIANGKIRDQLEKADSTAVLTLGGKKENDVYKYKAAENVANAVVLGNNASANANNTVGIGYGASANGSNSATLGTFAFTGNEAKNSTAIGVQSYVSKADSLALGAFTDVRGSESIAQGIRATIAEDADSAIAIGNRAAVYNYIRNGEKKYSKGSIAIGADTTVSAQTATAVGYNSIVESGADRSSIFGFNARAATNAVDSLALGSSASVSSSNALALGNGAVVHINSNNSAAIGKATTVSGENNFVAGNDSNVTGKDNVTLGQNVYIGDNNTVGTGSTIQKATANLVLGNNTGAGALVTNSAVIGYGAGIGIFNGTAKTPLDPGYKKEDYFANNEGSTPINGATALGYFARVSRYSNRLNAAGQQIENGNRATALGAETLATLDNSVALGYKSTTDYFYNGTPGNNAFLPVLGKDTGAKSALDLEAYFPAESTYNFPVNTADGIISVGGYETTTNGAINGVGLRRIVNAAPGALDTDVATVGQLKGVLYAKTDKNATYYYEDTVGNKIRVKVAADGKFKPYNPTDGKPYESAAPIDLSKIKTAIKTLPATEITMDVGGTAGSQKVATIDSNKTQVFANVTGSVMAADSTNAGLVTESNNANSALNNPTRKTTDEAAMALVQAGTDDVTKVTTGLLNRTKGLDYAATIGDLKTLAIAGFGIDTNGEALSKNKTVHKRLTETVTIRGKSGNEYSDDYSADNIATKIETDTNGKNAVLIGIKKTPTFDNVNLSKGLTDPSATDYAKANSGQNAATEAAVKAVYDKAISKITFKDGNSPTAGTAEVGLGDTFSIVGIKTDNESRADMAAADGRATKVTGADYIIPSVATATTNNILTKVSGSGTDKKVEISLNKDVTNLNTVSLVGNTDTNDRYTLSLEGNNTKHNGGLLTVRRNTNSGTVGSYVEIDGVSVSGYGGNGNGLSKIEFTTSAKITLKGQNSRDANTEFGVSKATEVILDGVKSGSIANNSNQAISGKQLDSLSTVLGTTTKKDSAYTLPNGSSDLIPKTLFDTPTFTKVEAGNLSNGATNFKAAIDDLIVAVNKGRVFGADNTTASGGTITNSLTKHLGEMLYITTGDFDSYKGANIATHSDGSKIQIGIKESPTFKELTLDNGGSDANKDKGTLTVKDGKLLFKDKPVGSELISGKNITYVAENGATKAHFDLNSALTEIDSITGTGGTLKFSTANEISTSGKLKLGVSGTIADTDENAVTGKAVKAALTAVSAGTGIEVTPNTPNASGKTTYTVTLATDLQNKLSKLANDANGTYAKQSTTIKLLGDSSSSTDAKSLASDIEFTISGNDDITTSATGSAVSLSLNKDGTVTSGGAKAVTSGAVYSAIDTARTDVTTTTNSGITVTKTGGTGITAKSFAIGIDDTYFDGKWAKTNLDNITKEGKNVITALITASIDDIANKGTGILSVTPEGGDKGNPKNFKFALNTEDSLTGGTDVLPTSKAVQDAIGKAVGDTTLKYAANGSEQTINLKTGKLNFTNGTNTTAEVAADGVVKFNVNSALTGIDSIAGNGSTLTLSSTGVSLNSKKLSGLQDATLDANSTEAVTGKQLHTLATNTIKLAGDSTATDVQALNTSGGLQFGIKGTTGDIQTTASGNDVTISLLKATAVADNEDKVVTGDAVAKYVTNQLNAFGSELYLTTAGGVAETNKQTLALKTGKLDITGDKNVSVSLSKENDNVKVGLSLGSALKGITSISAKADGTNPITIGNDGSISIEAGKSGKNAANVDQILKLVNGSDKNGTNDITFDPTTGKWKNLPDFTALKGENGTDNTAPTNLISAINKVIDRVNDGLTFGADQNATGTASGKQYLGSTLEVKKATSTITESSVDYVGDNLITSYSNTSGNGLISIGMKKTPKFEGLKLQAPKDNPNDSENPAINVTPGKDGTLELGKDTGTGTDPVVLKGLKDDDDDTSAVTRGALKKLAQKIGADGTNGNTGPAGRDGSEGPAGKDGLNGTNVTEKINAIRNGEAGTLVYTNKAGDRVVRDGDKFYKASDLVNKAKDPDGKWYDLKPDGTLDKAAGDKTPTDTVPENEVQLTTVNPDGTTTKPTTIGNIARALGTIADKEKKLAEATTPSDLKTAKDALIEATKKAVAGTDGLNGTDGLVNKTEGLNNAVTVGDLKTLAIAGLDFGVNGIPTSSTNNAAKDTEVHKVLGQKIGILGGTLYVDADFSGENIATKVKDGNILIGMKTTPKFKGLELGTDKPITFTPTTEGTTPKLTLGVKGKNDKVVLNGLQDDENDDTSAVTRGALKKLAQKIGADGTNGNTGPEGRDGSEGPAGKDGLDGTTIVEKINAIRNGEAGTLVYTNKDGDRVVRDGDKFYKASDLAGKVKGADGKWYPAGTELDEHGMPKTPADGTAPTPLALNAIDPDDLQLTTVNPDGKTTEPTVVGNVASTVKDVADKAILNKASTDPDLTSVKDADTDVKAKETDLNAKKATLDTAKKDLEGIDANAPDYATKKAAVDNAENDFVAAENALVEAKKKLQEELNKVTKTKPEYMAKAVAGANGTDGLVNQTEGLNNAATVGDLKTLAIAGLDFGANGSASGTDDNVHKVLGQKIGILGGKDNHYDGTYSSENIATKVDNGNILIGMKKTPKFEGLELQAPATGTTQSIITLTPITGATPILTLGGKSTSSTTPTSVVLDGVAAGKVSSDSNQAINGSQLYTVIETLNKLFGYPTPATTPAGTDETADGTGTGSSGVDLDKVFDPNGFGNVTASPPTTPSESGTAGTPSSVSGTIGDTGAGNIHDAIGNMALKVAENDNAPVDVRLRDKKLYFVNGDSGNIIAKVVNDGGNAKVTFSLEPDLVVKSVKVDSLLQPTTSGDATTDFLNGLTEAIDNKRDKAINLGDTFKIINGAESKMSKYYVDDKNNVQEVDPSTLVTDRNDPNRGKVKIEKQKIGANGQPEEDAAGNPVMETKYYDVVKAVSDKNGNPLLVTYKPDGTPVMNASPSEAIHELAKGNHYVKVNPEDNTPASPAKAKGKNAVAIGVNAESQAENGVAIGAGSVASLKPADLQGEQAYLVGADPTVNGEVSFGKAADANNPASAKTSRLTNVAAGVRDTDAVNVKQLKAIGNSIQGIGNGIQTLRQEFNQERGDLRAGIAGALASAGLPIVNIPGKSTFAVAGGTYRGQNAVAFGVSRVSDSGRVIIKITGNSDSRGNLGGTIGAGFVW